jgi:hypothetical protein
LIWLKIQGFADDSPDFEVKKARLVGGHHRDFSAHLCALAEEFQSVGHEQGGIDAAVLFG